MRIASISRWYVPNGDVFGTVWRLNLAYSGLLFFLFCIFTLPASAQPVWRRNPPVVPSKAPVIPDYSLRITPESGGCFLIDTPQAGTQTVLVRGLSRGGLVSVTVNGLPPQKTELLTINSRDHPRATQVLIRALLSAGTNEIRVREDDGIQAVRLLGTNCWSVVSTFSDGRPMLTLNFDHFSQLPKQFPVSVNYGPQWDSFLWFSGRWDAYCSDVYADVVTRVCGSSGVASAVLAYDLECPRLSLVMPTQLTVTPDSRTGTFTIRVHQVLRATETTQIGTGVQFLHVKIGSGEQMDWHDGTTDYVWYRSQSGDCPDAPPGSHTGMARFDDNSFRTYSYCCSTEDPARIITTSPHHTSCAVLLNAANTIGGFFSKTGVGSCGWVFHQYHATFRDDLCPIFGHCGDGADPHFFLTAFEMFNPLPMRAGDRVLVDYTLSFLTSEVGREDIEDLNEADLYLFGDEKTQKSTITGWIGTKQAVGVKRSDGSLLLLGIGQEPGYVPVPALSQTAACSTYRVYDLVRPVYEHAAVVDGVVGVIPGWFTVVDCGSALHEPHSLGEAHALDTVPSWDEVLKGVPNSVTSPTLPPLLQPDVRDQHPGAQGDEEDPAPRTEPQADPE